MQDGPHNEIMLSLGKCLEGIQGINGRLDKVNGRLDRHDEKINGLEKINSEEEGRRGAFDWVGNLVAGIIGLIAGLVGSFIQAGKL